MRSRLGEPSEPRPVPKWPLKRSSLGCYPTTPRRRTLGSSLVRAPSVEEAQQATRGLGLLDEGATHRPRHAEVLAEVGDDLRVGGVKAGDGLERRLRLGAALGLGFWGKGRGKSRVKKMRTCEWMAIPLPRILLKSFSPSTTWRERRRCV